MIRNRVDVITLGCSKNLVDSERLMARFEAIGWTVRHDPQHIHGEVVVINTCGFIGDAKEESVNTILEFCQAKADRRIERLYVMGCLSQRYKRQLQREMPEVDKFYGKFNWTAITDEVQAYVLERDRKQNNLQCCGCSGNAGTSKGAKNSPQRTVTTGHYAYIKIAEGCDRHCAYCAIPIITGRYKSRRMEDIIAEVEGLVRQGIHEFQVIAQDLTYYGLDLYKEQRIAELIDRMARVKGVRWIRLHYAYPNHFPMDLLDVMARHNNICRYLDLALQHISNTVLDNMRRNFTSAETYTLINRIRQAVPGIHLRTTLMVGFPGEGEAEFEELKEFVRWARFERMGAFAYCEEDGTYSAQHYDDNVPAEEKQRRLDELMALQQEISAAVQDEKIGQELDVIIDRREGDYYIGRTEYDSPEVDPEVLIRADRPLRRGCIYRAHIDDADDFDLYASITR